jgi:hypothetical protein
MVVELSPPFEESFPCPPHAIKNRVRRSEIPKVRKTDFILSPLEAQNLSLKIPDLEKK